MALVSPGLQLTVTDESQYVSAAVGTVPLVVLATAQDKTVNGSVASGTSKANAGKLQIFGSQRELVTALGYPLFQQSSAGTPLHGNELNEYGLMAAYSALGLGNRVYAIRADIDLNQLKGTSVRPKGEVADGTYWLDLANTKWGIYEWSAETQAFTPRTPIIITSSSDTVLTTVPATHNVTLYNEPAPKDSIGQVGSYAVVATTTNNRVFYKRGGDKTDPRYNTWQLIGSTGWHSAWPTVAGTTNPTFDSGLTITINTIPLVVNGTAIEDVISAINGSVPGVEAKKSGTGANARIVLYASNLSSSTNTTVDGILAIEPSVLAQALGLNSSADPLTGTTAYYNTPEIQYGSYAEAPAWNAAGTARPTGSIWFKTGALGGGSNFVFKKYNALTGSWVSQASQSFNSESQAIATLDVAGGSNIGVGTVILREDPNSVNFGTLNVAGFKPFVRTVSGAVKATGNVPSAPFVNGNTFTLTATVPASDPLSQGTISQSVTVNGTDAAAFVQSVLAANVPNVTAQVESNGAISLIHLAGGTIYLAQNAGQQNIPYVAGFTADVANVRVTTTEPSATRVISGFQPLRNPDGSNYTFSITEPYADPEDGTLWYSNDATMIDVMVNDGTTWRGYQNLTADARGYNLANTDPMGVIVSASRPTTQSDGVSGLAQGDLWLDSADLENWPAISRWNGKAWIAIDSTDQISQNGVVFADARWDGIGVADPVSGSMPDPAKLLTSDYTDLDCPNPRLYPRGMLLVNTRLSGFNVKRYLSNYFNTDTFSVAIWNGTNSYNSGAKVVFGTTIYVAVNNILSNSADPTVNSDWQVLQSGAWVTASGNKNDGSMYSGHKAQRQMIVAAMAGAIESNTQIREDQFQFNLITAPGYPELISEMVGLNNDRANTAFVIGDTPMTLSTNVVDITNWSTDANGDGLATSDPYLGIYYPSGLTTDVQGHPIMVPPSHMALRTFIHNDNVSYPWFAPAGTRRGLVDNATDLGYLNPVTGEFVRSGVNQALRDSLYSLNINPMTIMTGIGLVVWGQKTRNPVASAMDRVNVARLVNYIRTILGKAGDGFLFEPNDKITRDQLKGIIEGALNDLVAKRGIYDYLVVCDTSNNTPDRIARNELYVDIAIEPMKDVEFIYIPIRLMNPGSIGGLGK